MLMSLFVAWPGGCASDPSQGYAAGSLHPKDVATVAVHIFENETFERSVEFELADVLVKEIEARTPMKVVPDRRADSILTGRVRSVRRELLSRSRQTGLSEEIMVSITIDFTWRDVRSDRVLVERQFFSGHGLFVPSRPTGEPIELGRFTAVQQLARDLVEEMRAEW
jgi:hypothetical protein